MSQETEGLPPGVRDNQLVMHLRQAGNLPDLGYALVPLALQLDDIVNVALDHPAELMQPQVVLAASDGDLNHLAEPGQALPIVAVQRLLQPAHAEALQLSRCVQSPLKVPDRLRPPKIIEGSTPG